MLRYEVGVLYRNGGSDLPSIVRHFANQASALKSYENLIECKEVVESYLYDFRDHIFLERYSEPIVVNDAFDHDYDGWEVVVE